jgi:multidrug efflux pump subunit AcrA (membrane-fusion protein)
VIGLGAWQVLTTRTQLRDARQQLKALQYHLSKTELEAKSTQAELAAAQKSLQSLRNEGTTTLLPIAPFPLVDNSQLLADLGNAYTQSTGYYFTSANHAWVTIFVNAFTTEEQRETVLAQEGHPYYIPDPVSEANAYVANGTIP